MNHQPYETWILEESGLTTAQKRELSAHLEDCQKCTKLEKSWRTARQQVNSMPAVDAPSGFSQRFQASLPLRRRIQELRQARILLISLITTAIAIFIALGIFILPHTSLVSVMIILLGGILKLINSVTQTWLFVSSIVRAVPTGLLIGVIASSSLFISLLAILWTVSFFRITMKGSLVTNEK